MSAKYIEGATSAEMHQTYLTKSFGPISKKIFDSDSDVQSVVLAIGQYWADEAEDAVHHELVPCVTVDPTWPSCLADNRFVVEGWVHGTGSFDTFKLGQDHPRLDANTNAISAFASCCHEITSQEDDLADSSRPYAIARRTSERPGYAIEVVGNVLRPEWEDVFELVEETNEPKRGFLGKLFGRN